MITVTKWMNADADENRDLGAKIGLTEQAISDKFRFCCYEIKLTLEVDGDGQSWCTHINDVPLTEKVSV